MSNGRTICTVCNYIYDENLGEPRQDIPPAIRFAELADNWRCPECGSDKDMFQPCSCVSYPLYEQTCQFHGSSQSAKDDIVGGIASATISKTATIGQLVAERPLRACVLEQYGIDYCCGGQQTLEDACRKKGLSVEVVLEKLTEADGKQEQTANPDWTTASLEDLVEHILTTYHQPLRKELSRVAPLADKVARVHGDRHPEMVKVQQVFDHFKAQLELHMQKEEMVLFPGIISMEKTGGPQIFGCGGGIEHPIEMMNQEHEEAGEALGALRKLTHDYMPPDDACNSYKALLCSLAQIESEMHQHVHKENNILFPRALALRKPLSTCK